MIRAAITKLVRELLWFPACIVCALAGFWLADWVAPQGMSFGAPLAERVGAAFKAGAYPIEFIVLLGAIAAAFVLVDWITPGRARGIVLCFFSALAGAYLYEAPYAQWLDDLAPNWPGLAGRIASLTVLVWPFIAMALSKLVPPLRARASTRG